MFTREEFEDKRLQWARDLAKDHQLVKDAQDLLARADQHNWIHQATWLGEPVLNLPWDMFALQEIIYRTRPRFIVEVGVAWGGSLLFYGTLMEALGGEAILGVDVYTPDDLKQRVGAHGRISERIHWITGSSLDSAVVAQVRAKVGDCRQVLVVLDSHHSHEHVLNELQLYSPLVGKGSYLVVSDTILEFIPPQEHRTRPWGPGNNPQTAATQFLQENRRFVVDEALENKLLFTCNPGGYLRALRD